MQGEKHVISLSSPPHTLALTHGGWTGGDEGEGGEAFFFSLDVSIAGLGAGVEL